MNCYCLSWVPKLPLGDTHVSQTDGVSTMDLLYIEKVLRLALAHCVSLITGKGAQTGVTVTHCVSFNTVGALTVILIHLLLCETVVQCIQITILM